MPYIVSIGTCSPPFYFRQSDVKDFVRTMFKDQFKNIDRLLRVFHNGQIEGRHFSAPLEWFKEEHTFEERNNRYVELAVELSVSAIQEALMNPHFLSESIDYESIDAIFFISSSGIATPSIEARIMNKLPFSHDIKRIPIWGLGCAGGAAGISRANEYCMAFPESNVLVLSVELCSLTFQKGDVSKSNLIGTSLFADGVACILVSGDASQARMKTRKHLLPYIKDSGSSLMPNSEDVMGWAVKDSGLHVIFSKDIPTIITQWLKPTIDQFLQKHQLTISNIQHFIAHPGGRKVLEAYERIFQLTKSKLTFSTNVLREYGNMSSATVLYVLRQFLLQNNQEHDLGIVTALGPGFSSEMVLLEWKQSNQEDLDHGELATNVI